MYSLNVNSILFPVKSNCLFLGTEEINNGASVSFSPPLNGTTCAHDETSKIKLSEKRN
jgi:hypothetical protein